MDESQSTTTEAAGISRENATPPNGGQQGPSILTTAARGSAIGFAGTIAGRTLAMVFQVWISRLYGPECFGLFVTGMLVCQILHIVASLGLQKGAMRFMSIAVEKRDFAECAEILKVAVLTSLAAAVPIVAIGYWLAPAVALKAFHNADLTPVLRLFLAGVPFLALLRIGSNISRAFKTAKYGVAIDDVLLPVLQIVFFAILHRVGVGFFAVAYAFVMASILCAIVMVLTIWRQIRRAGGAMAAPFTVPSAGKWIEITAYSVPLAPVGLIFMANNFMDIIMLNILSNPLAVGTYAAAARWIMLFGAVTMPMEMMFGPLIAGQFGVNNRGQLQFLYQTLTRWAFFLSLPVFVFVTLARTPLMVLFGSQFLPLGPAVLGILVLGSMIAALACGAGVTLIVSNNQKYELVACVAGLLLNIFLNVLLIPRYGVIGTAWAVLVSVTGAALLRLAAVYRSMGLAPFSRHLAIPASVGGLIAGADIVSRRFFYAGDVIQIGIATVGAIIVLSSIFFHGLDKNDMDLLRSFWQKLMRFGERRDTICRENRTRIGC